MRWLALVLSLFLLPPSAPARAGEPDALVIGFGSSISSIDPHFHTLTPNNLIALHFFDTLSLQDEHQRLMPGLAESWRAIDDTHWEFKLRRGVKFSDGSDFTAEDVLATFKRIPEVPNSPSPFTIYLRGITEVVATDPYTLRITTDAPAPLIPNMLSRISIINRKMVDASTADFNAGRAMIGTGPYRFVEYVPGDRIVMERNEGYWGPRPLWRTVTFRIMNNATTRTAALRAGDVQMIDRVPTTDIPQLKTDPAFNVVSAVSNRVIYLHLDLSRDGPSPFVTDKAGKPLAKNPFKDLRVRRALSKAINRPALVDRVLGGQGIPAGQFLPEGFFGVSPKIKPEPYDPAGAKKLLAQAGYPDGFGVTLHGPNDRYIEDAKTLQAVGQMLSRIGVEAKVETLPYASYASRAARQELSLFMGGWGSGTGEMSAALQAIIVTADPKKGLGTTNWGRYSNPEVDQAFERGITMIDDAKRERLFQQAMELGMADVAVIPLHYEISTWALRKGFTYQGRSDQYTLAMGVKPSP